MALTEIPIELSSTPSIVDGGNATAITIDSSENVGIGVVPSTWPSDGDYRALQIGSGLSLYGRGSGDEDRVGMTANAYLDVNNSRFEYIGSGHATHYAQTDGNHVWSTAASGSANGAISFSESMRIDASGNVIIGGSTAGDAAADNLTLVDSGNAGVTIQAGDTSYASIYFKDSASPNPGYIQYKQGDDFMRFATAGSERMRIGSSGNVGIGRSSNIDYLLDVQKPADAYIRISSSTTQENAGIILANQNTTKWTIEKDTSAHQLFVKSASVTAMTISQAGNVTTPSQPSDYRQVSGQVTNINANGSYKRIYFGTSRHAINSMHSAYGGNAANGSKFTAPVAGRYFFSCILRIDGFGGNYCYLDMRVNDTTRARHLDSETGTYLNRIVTGVYNLAVGDYITFEFISNGDDVVTMDADTYASVHLLG